MRVAQSMGKKNEIFWQAQDTNKHILMKYFVRTGNPRYLGIKQYNIFFLSKILNMGVKVAMFGDSHQSAVLQSLIWKVSPRAGIDCYEIGFFFFCSEAYKFVDLFSRLL